MVQGLGLAVGESKQRVFRDWGSSVVGLRVQSFQVKLTDPLNPKPKTLKPATIHTLYVQRPVS